MALEPDVIARPGPFTAPLTYTLGTTETLRPRAVFAKVDGTSASGLFLICVSFYDQAGRLISRAFPDNQLAAGASADVSWFPRLRTTTTTPAPSPNPLGTLFAWYDFADSSTITADGSGNIAKILDKTGNGHDATQSVAAQRPAQSTLNALNCGSFIGANNTWLTSSGWSATLAQPLTILAVWTEQAVQSSARNAGPFGGGPIPAPPVVFMESNNNTLAAEQGIGTIGIALTAPFAQQQVTALYNGASSYIRLNGVQANGTVDVGTMTNVSLGSAHVPYVPGVIGGITGKLGEVLVYKGQLTAAQLTAIESYLKTKWATP